jgi:hypothetical protein
MITRYPAVGQCIYCGTKQPPLRAEHIIARALNGTLILPEASCDDCGKITGKIEGFNTQNLGLFGPARYANRMRSRQRSKWPKVLPVGIQEEGGPEITIDVPLAEFPASISLPVLRSARWLDGEPDDGSPTRGSSWWTTRHEGRLQAFVRKWGLKRGTRVFSGTVNPSQFSQMLAKIAHAAAVAEFGIDGFTPMALDLAMGRSQSINYLVGCSPVEPQPPPKENHLHSIRFRSHGAGHPLLVEIRLFASFGAPRYHVVVGIKKD